MLCAIPGLKKNLFLVLPIGCLDSLIRVRVRVRVRVKGLGLGLCVVIFCSMYMVIV
jgi:hypothetical protein